MSGRDLTPDEVGALFGKGRDFVLDQCRAGRWPHQRYGRTYAFTAEQVEQIRSLSAVGPKTEQAAAASWGRATRGGAA